MASKAGTAGAGGVAARWHESLPIQINWTYEVDYYTARIFCPGNVRRWEMAIVHGMPIRFTPMTTKPSVFR